MKLRGTLGGLNLLLEPGDTGTDVAEALAVRAELLATSVTIEVDGDADPEALVAALSAIRAAGGMPGRVRAPRVTVPGPNGAGPNPATPTDFGPAQARTEVVPHNLRAGFRGEYRGSVVILGDVNPGVEIVAGGDVIVMGALRGVVHAGFGGHEGAIVWGRPIASPQIRIGNAVARAPEGSSLSNMRRMEGHEGAELARLQDGVIVIDAQK
ncbi:septum site-determining protein MinC [Deinococcus sp. QL22]|uniref:septum site-determining protein MinC n=1 Tax=Deinococcus sp. QL22 TaxID=2939437 RepID=UPI002016C92E|nr:septum site-determining protein MinC [Deinococcus sp. QL22]UQN06081.1 septum site-determining protein MinC [Deinococcus sp. QL22]